MRRITQLISNLRVRGAGGDAGTIIASESVIHCRMAELTDYLPIPLVASLPPLSHFPPLIHLSDFTGTLGDPGQTSCRGNRQSRNILYFFSECERNGSEREKEREKG